MKLAVCKEELHDYSNSVTGSNTSELSVCIKHPDFSARRPIPDALKSYTLTWLSCMLLIANCPWLSSVPDDLFDESWQLSMAHFISLILLCINLEQFETQILA